MNHQCMQHGISCVRRSKRPSRRTIKLSDGREPPLTLDKTKNRDGSLPFAGAPGSASRKKVKMTAFEKAFESEKALWGQVTVEFGIRNGAHWGSAKVGTLAEAVTAAQAFFADPDNRRYCDGDGWHSPRELGCSVYCYNWMQVWPVVVTPNSMISRRSMHGLMHDWTFQCRRISWVYESRPANFRQGPSPRPEPQSAAPAGAFRLAAVLGPHERPALAPQWPARLVDQGADRLAQGAGQARLTPSPFMPGRAAVPPQSAPAAFPAAPRLRRQVAFQASRFAGPRGFGPLPRPGHPAAASSTSWPPADPTTGDTGARCPARPTGPLKASATECRRRSRDRPAPAGERRTGRTPGACNRACTASAPRPAPAPATRPCRRAGSPSENRRGLAWRETWPGSCAPTCAPSRSSTSRAATSPVCRAWAA
jgi:hypothetical protein